VGFHGLSCSNNQIISIYRSLPSFIWDTDIGLSVVCRCTVYPLLFYFHEILIELVNAGFLSRCRWDRRVVGPFGVPWHCPNFAMRPPYREVCGDPTPQRSKPQTRRLLYIDPRASCQRNNWLQQACPRVCLPTPPGSNLHYSIWTNHSSCPLANFDLYQRNSLSAILGTRRARALKVPIVAFLRLLLLSLCLVLRGPASR
jgi:hypothetical protein